MHSVSLQLKFGYTTMKLWEIFFNTTLSSWHLKELNAIVSGAQSSNDIQTLAYFGGTDEIELYIRAGEERTIPKLVISDHLGEVHFKNVAGVNNNLFFVAVGELQRKSFWHYMNSALAEMQSRVRGVFITRPPNGRRSQLNLREHFEWCWHRGFSNTLILVDREKSSMQHFEMYNYNPFLVDQVYNVTLELKTNLYPDKFRNLHNYPIKTMAQFDPPRVFERRQCHGQKSQELSGYVANIFRAFLREYNASTHLINLVPNKTLNIYDILHQMNQGEIELSINPYVPHKGTQLSYPIRMLQRCVVVPSAKELPKYRYFIMPFSDDVWLCSIMAWLGLSVARLLYWLESHRRCECSQLDVGRTFLEVGRLMIFLPIPSTCCSRSVRWYHILWFVHIVALAFILSNLYLASLTSFFSGLSFRPQVTTLAQLVERQAEIDTIDYEIPGILENRGLPKGFAELLKPRDASALLEEVLALKRGHIYSALIDRIQFVLNQERHLLKPSKHIVGECINTVPFGFVMPTHSQFELPLNRFILRCASAGLIDKWIDESIVDAYCTRLLTTRVSDFQVARPLTLEHFQFGWYVLGGGYVTSFAVFLLENMSRILRRFKIFVIYY